MAFTCLSATGLILRAPLRFSGRTPQEFVRTYYKSTPVQSMVALLIVLVTRSPLPPHTLSPRDPFPAIRRR